MQGSAAGRGRGDAGGRVNTSALKESQRKVFDQLILGKTNKAIGEALHLSEKTIKTYVTAIFKALGCASRAEVIARHYRGAA